MWVQRRGCRVTNEILVPFCLQYCRGCIQEKGKGVGQKVGHCLRGTPLAANEGGGRGGGGEEVREREEAEEGECSRPVQPGIPLKNYLFLAGWTGAPPRRSPRLD